MIKGFILTIGLSMSSLVSALVYAQEPITAAIIAAEEATTSDTRGVAVSNNTMAAALGQAASALSANGICGKDARILFGLIQWSDYSDKCFHYHLALIAAQQGSWDLTNQWVVRAEGMW